MFLVSLRQELLRVNFTSAVWALISESAAPLTWRGSFGGYVEIFLLEWFLSCLDRALLLSVCDVLIKLSLIDLPSGRYWSRGYTRSWPPYVCRLGSRSILAWGEGRLDRLTLTGTSRWSKFLIGNLDWLFAFKVLLIEGSLRLSVIYLRAYSHFLSHFVAQLLVSAFIWIKWRLDFLDSLGLWDPKLF